MAGLGVFCGTGFWGGFSVVGEVGPDFWRGGATVAFGMGLGGSLLNNESNAMVCVSLVWSFHGFLPNSAMFALKSSSLLPWRLNVGGLGCIQIR